MTLSRTPPKSPSAAATALSFKVCSPAGRSFGKGIRVNSPLKAKDGSNRQTPKKSPTFGLGLVRSPPAPEHTDLPVVAIQISPTKDGGEKYEIVAKSPTKATKPPAKQHKTPSKPLLTPTKAPLRTPTKIILIKSPKKPPAGENLNSGLGQGPDRGRRPRRVVLIPVERSSPLKSELQSNWEARHDINNLDNYSARIRESYMASASASQSEVEETMLVAARDAETETTGNSAEEETHLDVSRERSVSEAQGRAGPVVSSALRKRHSTGKEEVGSRGTKDPEISPIKEPVASNEGDTNSCASNKALRKHQSADRILLPLSQENLERRKQEKRERRRHHSTGAAGERRRSEKRTEASSTSSKNSSVGGGGGKRKRRASAADSESQSPLPPSKRRQLSAAAAAAAKGGSGSLDVNQDLTPQVRTLGLQHRQVKHCSTQLKSIRQHGDGGKDKGGGGGGGDGSVIRALGLVRRPNDAAARPSHDSKRGKKADPSMKDGKKCRPSLEPKGAESKLREYRRTSQKCEDTRDATSHRGYAEKAKSAKSDLKVSKRNASKPDKEANECNAAKSDSEDVGKSKKDVSSGELKESMGSGDTRSGPTELTKSRKGNLDAKEGAVGMTRFGLADAGFEFKLERCKLFSFSKIHKKARVMKGDLNRRLFGDSPNEKKRGK